MLSAALSGQKGSHIPDAGKDAVVFAEWMTAKRWHEGSERRTDAAGGIAFWFDHFTAYQAQFAEIRDPVRRTKAGQVNRLQIR
jgi:hypothetical protein